MMLKKRKEQKKRKTDGLKIRRWILLYLWVLSLAAISYYGGAVSYGIFFGITLIPAVSLTYLAAVYFCLGIFQRIESRNMVCGQAMPYFFVLQNDGHFAFASISVKLFSSFSFVEKLPGDAAYELLPGERQTFETKLTCRYRGEYEVGVKEIVMTDFFRLFRIRYRLPSTIRALVLPKITRVTKLGSIEEFTALLSRESMRERTEPDVSVRDYIPGDALKQIHWKASAREQKLKVRSLTGEEKQGISILWDIGRPGREMREYLPVESKILEIVLAIGFFLAENGIEFSGCCGQDALTEKHVESLRDFDGFYQMVSDVIFCKEENFSRLLSAVIKRGIILRSKVVFCVLRELDEEVLRFTEEFERAGILTVLYVVTDETAADTLWRGNERRRIITIPVEAELEGRL